MKDVTQRNFTQPRGWIGTISYTIFLPEKTLANFYLEDGGSMKLCSSNCCAVWTLQQSPKNQNYGYQWFGALEYELLSLFAQYVVQEQQVLAAFSIFTQREYLQSKCWHVPAAMHETALFFLCRQPTECPSAFVTTKTVLHTRERIAFVLFPRQYQLQ